MTSGVIEATVRDLDGHPLAGLAIAIRGAAGFHAVVYSNSNGAFAITLPYGQYTLSWEGQYTEGSAMVFVAPLQTIHVDLVIEASGSIQATQTALPIAGGDMRLTLPESFHKAPRRGLADTDYTC